MNIIIKRLLSKTPKIFRNIRNIALAVAALSASALTMETLLSDYIIALFGKTTLVSGAVAAFIAQLTTIFPSQEYIDNKTK